MIHIVLLAVADHSNGRRALEEIEAAHNPELPEGAEVYDLTTFMDLCNDSMFIPDAYWVGYCTLDV